MFLDNMVPDEIGMNVLDDVSYLYISVPDDTVEDNATESNELPILFHPESISIVAVVGTSLRTNNSGYIICFIHLSIGRSTTRSSAPTNTRIIMHNRFIIGSTNPRY
jgi:hypothetical protein